MNMAIFNKDRGGEASAPHNNIFHRIRVNRAQQLQQENELIKNLTLHDIH